MRVSMIAELEASVEPLVECSDAGVDFPDFQVELVFVDEADGGNLLLLERSDNAGGHVRDFLCRHGLRGAGGEIVDRNGNAALRLGLRKRELSGGESDQEKCQLCAGDHGDSFKKVL